MLDEYILKNNKRLRYGYTTGSCATAASMASAIMLLSDDIITQVKLKTPKGIELLLDVLDIDRNSTYAKCCIQKDSGDDPDITDKIKVYSKVSKIPERKILIDGGLGVGRVTKAGLEQPVGNAAINKTPRKMIADELTKICEQYGYNGGFKVEIIIPEGVEKAKKTFNPRLGIEGGISVLGTSGIVEPMSEKALVDSIKVEMKMLFANGIKDIVVTPGNYGIEHIQKVMNCENKLTDASIVKCSNYVGETLDFACELGFEKVTLVGHSGKFVKLAGGIMNTHSSNADCRLEIITAHAGVLGASIETMQKIMKCVTTTEALELLDGCGLKTKVMDSITEKICFYVDNRIKKLDSDMKFDVYMY